MRISLRMRLACAAASGVVAAGPAWAQAAPGPALPALRGPAVPGLPGAPAADPPGRVGQLAQVSGVVSFHLADAVRWEAASANLPVTTGSAFWTEPAARAAVEVAGTRLVMDAATELDMVQLDDHALTASLPQGRMYAHVRVLAAGDTEAVTTPRAAVSLLRAGRYEIEAGDTGRPTVVTVVEGEAEVTPGGGSVLRLTAGQAATIVGDGVQAPFTATVGPAGRDAFLTAMLAEERPVTRPAAAPAYVAAMTGSEALDTYGEWASAPEYGAIWYPPAEAGFVPYRRGHWAFVAPWGWTWVDDAPWGFAPSHYGRWVQVSNRWGWLPGQGVGIPVYAPAVVSFLGGVALGSAFGPGYRGGYGGGYGRGFGPGVGWVPLGPNEGYIPPYRVSAGYVRTLNVANVTNVNVVVNQYGALGERRGPEQAAFLNRAAATAVPVAAMVGSRSLVGLARAVPPGAVAPVLGRAPVMPTRQTLGVTNAVARQLNLPGMAVPRGAPGPAFRAGLAGAPPLRGMDAPGGRPGGGAPGPALPGPGTPGPLPQVVGPPLRAPALRPEPGVPAVSGPPGVREGGQEARPELRMQRPPVPQPQQQPPQLRERGPEAPVARPMPPPEQGLERRPEMRLQAPGGERPVPRAFVPPPQARQAPPPVMRPAPAPPPAARPAPPPQARPAPPPQARPEPPPQARPAPPPQARPGPPPGPRPEPQGAGRPHEHEGGRGEERR